MRLARALSGAFTVYVPGRRGRGRSGPYGAFHGLSTEIEDLSALLDACGASRLFGLSSGAVIAIEAALVRPDITKLDRHRLVPAEVREPAMLVRFVESRPGNAAPGAVKKVATVTWSLAPHHDRQQNETLRLEAQGCNLRIRLLPACTKPLVSGI